MGAPLTADAKEIAFLRDVINELVAGGWVLGDPARYDRENALYSEDCLAFVMKTQPKTWKKYCGISFIGLVAAQLNKVDPRATDAHLRKFGTLGVLRHERRDKSCSFKMCQFRPEHGLNPEIQGMYDANILRVLPELVYSQYAADAHLQETGSKAKAYRIDLVLFVNGVPVATLELKSEFKQWVDRAVRQYRKTRLPKDPATNKPEPLLTFKRGALVHFAVSQYEVQMATRLEGDGTHFLPFNRRTKDGGAGNPLPEDLNRYGTTPWCSTVRDRAN